MAARFISKETGLETLAALIDALVKCGAMDSLHGRANRAAMSASIDDAVSAAQSVAKDKAAGQGGLFGGADAPAPIETPAPPGMLEESPSWMTRPSRTTEAASTATRSWPRRRITVWPCPTA